RARIQAFRCDVAISDPGCSGGGAQGLRGAMQAGGPKAADPRGHFDFDAAHSLYRDLFGGLDGIVENYPNLIIAPPSDMLRLPFAALVTTPGTPKRLRRANWMIRSHAISVLPSITSLRALRDGPRAPRKLQRMVGFGDPVIGAPASVACDTLDLAALRAAPPMTSHIAGADRATGVALADVGYLSALPRLPDAVCELQAIAKGFGPQNAALHLGADATEAQLKSMDQNGTLEGFDVVVFATHGLTAGEAGGIAPGLVLTPPAQASLEDDGLLTAGEIASLNLNADLVVLSACNTAAGDRGDEDGLSGLARAFFQSGARSLLVTHWSVYSEAAVDMTTGLFQALNDDGDLSYASALQAATHAVLDDPTRPAFQYHPSYWGAFSIVGAS
ncbi:MAG: CHAT domain-containing protein, partial [Sedimentitalea sp.]